MNKNRSPLWVGIAVGIVAAFVAPLLALAHHDSGEQSGDDPIQLAAGAGSAGSATASFRILRSGDIVDSYRLDVSRSGLEASSGAQVNEDGAVLPADCRGRCLRQQDFTVTRCALTCSTSSWELHGWLGVNEASTLTDSSATFSGLASPPGGGFCRIDVTFHDFGAPRVLTAQDDDAGAHSLESSGRVRVGRSAIADMSIECEGSAVDDLTATSVDAAVFTDVAGSVRAVADPTG